MDRRKANVSKVLFKHERYFNIVSRTLPVHFCVHSYQMKLTSRNDLIASTNYGGEIAAMVGRDNMVGTQFHPEKSQALGLALIANFLRWTP